MPRFCLGHAHGPAAWRAPCTPSCDETRTRPMPPPNAAIGRALVSYLESRSTRGNDPDSGAPAGRGVLVVLYGLSRSSPLQGRLGRRGGRSRRSKNLPLTPLIRSGNSPGTNKKGGSAERWSERRRHPVVSEASDRLTRTAHWRAGSEPIASLPCRLLANSRVRPTAAGPLHRNVSV